MCDEYYDARMKAFWRAVATEEEDRKIDEVDPIEGLIAIRPLEVARPKPKPLAR